MTKTHESDNHKHSDDQAHDVHKTVHKHHAIKHHTKKRVVENENSKTIFYVVGGLVLLLLISVLTSGFSNFSMFEFEKNSDSKQEKKANALPIELYVMSQCPYGVQAQDGMFPAIQTLGEEYFDLQVDFISTDLGGGQFRSLHGDPETKGNIVQLCGNEYNPDKFLDMVLCMNENMDAIPGNWESCASKLDMDVNAIKTCYEGSEGKELLSASVVRAESAGATGSPTIFVNGLPYQGGRTERDFITSFCQSFEGERPSACDSIPEPVKVDLIILNDELCGSACSTAQIMSATQQLFPGVRPRTVDVSSQEGKELIAQHSVEVVPMYIFDESVTRTETWVSRPGFDTNFKVLADGSYALLDVVTGASYYIDPEKQAERLAIMGIEKGDNRPQMDFFVMSYCPYGNIAEEAIVEAYEQMKEFADFYPRYIYYANYGGGGSEYCFDEQNQLCSMHGIVEGRQNVREQCVLEKYGTDAWFDFAIEMNSKCTYTNADTCYVDVARNLGYDVDYIASCQEERAIEFASVDAELMALFGAQGSPAVYVDGIEYNGPRSGSGYMAAICAAFEDAPALCDGLVVQESTAVPQGAC